MTRSASSPRRARRSSPLVAVALVAACAVPGARPGPARAPTAAAGSAAAAEPAPGAADPARLAYLRELRDHDGPLPADADVVALVDEVAGLLASPDPQVRDELAYVLLARWIVRQGLVPPAALDALEARLSDLRRAGLDTPGESDLVFGRSFAALASSLVAARESQSPSWSSARVGAVVADAGWYAAREHDLRGYVAGRGWAHAAAHTADWLLFLARHPALDPATGPAVILQAIVDLAVRPHGYNFHHGEDGRLARPVLALVHRGLVDRAAFQAFVQRLAAPLHAPETSAFDPTSFAAQRNARNLLFTLFVQLSLAPARTAAEDDALAVLAELLRG